MWNYVLFSIIYSNRILNHVLKYFSNLIYIKNKALFKLYFIFFAYRNSRYLILSKIFYILKKLNNIRKY